jgi:UDP-glucose 4-epimerase
MTSVLVTGANGLLGRTLIPLLARTGHSVVAISRVMPTAVADCVVYKSIDFASNWDCADLPLTIDVVIHLAQSQHFREFPTRAIDVYKVNLDSTALLLDYALRAGARQFIYTSSGGVYGNGQIPLTESQEIVATGDHGFYLGTKTASEVLVKSYLSMFNIAILRPFFMYGPGQNRDMLIPRLLDSVIAERPITINGFDGIRINPVHVNDAGKAVVAALSVSKSFTANIAGPEVLSIREIVTAMGQHVGKIPVIHSTVGGSNDLIADISIMRSMLHNPELRLTDSLPDVLT